MKAAKRKYPYTKQLIRLAQEVGGLTYKQIAVRSRISTNSTALVSKWAKGTAKASYTQMQSLIDEFGGHLKKQFEHVFYQHRPKLTLEKVKALKDESLEITLDVDGDQKSLGDLNDEELKSVLNSELGDLNVSCSTEDGDVVRDILLSLDLVTPKFDYFRVKGEKVFQHTFNHYFEGKKITRRHSLYRIQILKQSEKLWYVVTQKRATHLSLDENDSDNITLPVHSSAEASMWWSQCHKLSSIADIVEFMDNYPNRFCFHMDCRIEARATLPYLIRSKLSELGYHLEEIVDISDDSTDH